MAGMTKSSDFLVVAVVLCDVEHSAQTAAETGGKGAFVEGDVLDSVGVEGGEEAAHVGDVVEGHAVEEEEVLVGAAAADVHAAVALAAGLHSGHELQGLDEVGLAEHDGHGLDFLHGHHVGTHLGGTDVAGALGCDDDFAEGDAGGELDVELAVGVELEVEELGFVAHEGDLEVDGVAAHGEGVVAVDVGHGSLAAAGAQPRRGAGLQAGVSTPAHHTRFCRNPEGVAGFLFL